MYALTGLFISKWGYFLKTQAVREKTPNPVTELPQNVVNSRERCTLLINPKKMGIGEVIAITWAVLLQQCHPNSAGSLVIAGRTE